MALRLHRDISHGVNVRAEAEVSHWMMTILMAAILNITYDQLWKPGNKGCIPDTEEKIRAES